MRKNSLPNGKLFKRAPRIFLRICALAIMGVIIFCFSLDVANATAPSVLRRETLRQEFEKAQTNSQVADNLVKMLDTCQPEWQRKEFAVVAAYYGALKGLQAKYAVNPAKKIKCLNQSLSWLDKAVFYDSSDLEVRFVRFATLHHLPAFFGIGKKRYDDISDIVRQLGDEDFSQVDKNTQKKMIDFMVDSHRLTQEQVRAMEKLRLKF